MDSESLHRLGKVGKPWGHQGELTLHLEDLSAEDLNHTGTFFVEIDGQHVPFAFSKLYEKGQHTLVKFEDFGDPQSASILVDCDLFAPPGHFSDASDESWDPEEFIGMVVKDEVHGELGEVTGMDGTDKNPVLVILHGEVEVMVPLVEEMIVDIDMEERSMTIRTPDGLIDLYRNA